MSDDDDLDLETLESDLREALPAGFRVSVSRDSDAAVRITAGLELTRKVPAGLVALDRGGMLFLIPDSLLAAMKGITARGHAKLRNTMPADWKLHRVLGVLEKDHPNAFIDAVDAMTEPDDESQ